MHSRKGLNLPFAVLPLFPVNAALAPFLPLALSRSFPVVACFPDNNLGIHFVYYRLSSFSISCSLAGPLTYASSVLSQSNVVEHVKSLLVLSMGLFALATKLKDGAFSNPAAVIAYLLLSSGEPWYNRSLYM